MALLFSIPLLLWNRLTILDVPIHKTILEHMSIKNKVYRFPCWFTPDLRRQITLKKIAHRNYKNNPNLNRSITFSRLWSVCKDISPRCYADYISKANSSVLDNVKFFWSFVNSKVESTNIIDSYYLNKAKRICSWKDLQLVCRAFLDCVLEKIFALQQITIMITLSISPNVFWRSGMLKGTYLHIFWPWFDTTNCTQALQCPSRHNLKAPFNNLLKRGVFDDSLKTSYVVTNPKAHYP